MSAPVTQSQLCQFTISLQKAWKAAPRAIHGKDLLEQFSSDVKCLGCDVVLDEIIVKPKVILAFFGCCTISYMCIYYEVIMCIFLVCCIFKQMHLCMNAHYTVGASTAFAPLIAFLKAGLWSPHPLVQYGNLVKSRGEGLSEK